MTKELLKLPEKQRANYIRKLLIALNYRPKLKLKLKTLMEERKMPLTITEEMAKEDHFYDCIGSVYDEHLPVKVLTFFIG